MEIIHVSQQSVEAFSKLEQAISLTDNPAEMATISNYTKALFEATKASDATRDMRDRAAILRLKAETKLGRLLQIAVGRGPSGVNLEEIGITRKRSSIAQKLASISDQELEQFIARQINHNRPVTINGALKLLPPKEKQPTHNIKQVYSVPPVDIEIVREMFHGIGEELITLLLKQLNEALQNISNTRFARVWLLRHGIDENGVYDKEMSFPQIAARLGTSREYVENLYYRASSEIYQSLAMDAWLKVRTLLGARHG